MGAFLNASPEQELRNVEVGPGLVEDLQYLWL